jgi:TPR repeat protein
MPALPPSMMPNIQKRLVFSQISAQEISMSIIKKVLLAAVVSLALSANVNANDKLNVGIFAKNEGRYEVALMAFKPLVEIGYGAAQYQMAEMYEFGLGVKKDITMAADLYQKAAKQGYAKAQFRVSRLLTDGTILKKDLKQAAKWLQKAANLGLAAAQYNLAILYYNGESGVLLSYKKAYYWYKQAAYQNYILAQFNLALMYSQGYGVKKSHINSYIWNKIAIRNGYKPAQQSLDVDSRHLTTSQIKQARMEVVKVEEKLQSTRTDHY